MMLKYILYVLSLNRVGENTYPIQLNSGEPLISNRTEK